MAWTAPKTWTVDGVLTAADMNTHVRDNLRYLLSPNKGVILHDNGADYSTTSTAWVYVDPTNLSITITTHGGPVLVLASVRASQGSIDTGGVDVAVDGTRIGAAAAFGLGNLTNAWIYFPICTIVALSAGSHTFRLQYRAASSTTTIYSNANELVAFAVIEL